MSATRIKICGITRPEDAEEAVSGGADALGLNFYAQSPRVVTEREAREIVAVVPPFVTIVGLFVDEPAERVQRTVGELPIDLLQFHGEETPAYCRQFGRPWIKALRMKPGLDIHSACDGLQGSRGVLLDAWQEGIPGGTGKTFDWALATGELSLPLILAGGLTAGNVAEAIWALRPAAVDVSSGVESAPGVKDATAIRRFIDAVREADRAIQESGDDR